MVVNCRWKEHVAEPSLRNSLHEIARFGRTSRSSRACPSTGLRMPYQRMHSSWLAACCRIGAFSGIGFPGHGRDKDCEHAMAGASAKFCRHRSSCRHAGIPHSRIHEFRRYQNRTPGRGWSVEFTATDIRDPALALDPRSVQSVDCSCRSGNGRMNAIVRSRQVPVRDRPFPPRPPSIS